MGINDHFDRESRVEDYGSTGEIATKMIEQNVALHTREYIMSLLRFAFLGGAISGFIPGKKRAYLNIREAFVWYQLNFKRKGK